MNEISRKLRLRYFISNLFIVIGLVMIWRGVWYVLDGFDYLFLGGNHYWSAFGGDHIRSNHIVYSR